MSAIVSTENDQVNCMQNTSCNNRQIAVNYYNASTKLFRFLSNFSAGVIIFFVEDITPDKISCSLLYEQGIGCLQDNRSSLRAQLEKTHLKRFHLYIP